MNNSFKKLISSATLAWIGSSAFAANTGTSFEQGYSLSFEQYPAAYNASARFEIQNSWDIFATGTFLYLVPNQDAMEIACYNTMDTSPQIPALGESVTLDNEFNPGFAVGMGVHFGYDKWVAYLEYTQYHQSTITLGHPSDIRGGETPIFRYTDWFTSIAFGGGFYIYGLDFSAKWRTKLDFVDATFSRPYYSGRQLTITPFGGLRGGWIRQNFRLSAITFDGFPTEINRISHNRSNSWAVGPRMGFNSRWLLRQGFRIETDLAASLLYTRFTKITHKDNDATQTYNVQMNGINAVRPMSDMKIGLGWGSYFDKKNYHFDVLAAYDFNILWRQNMMRSLSSITMLNTSGVPGDLTLQGLSAQARLDF